MTTHPQICLPVLLSGLCLGVLVATAWAHHPLSRLGTGGDWPWPQLWFLGVCVLGVVFAVTWAVFAFSDRRQRTHSAERASARR